MKYRIKNSDVCIALLKILFKLNQNLRRQFSIVGITRSIVLVTDLNYQFIKRLFLLAVKNMVVVIFNNSVLALLFFIVLLQSCTKQFLVNFFNIFLMKNDIVLRTAAVNIIGIEVTIVVTDTAFAYGYA